MENPQQYASTGYAVPTGFSGPAPAEMMPWQQEVGGGPPMGDLPPWARSTGQSLEDLFAPMQMRRGMHGMQPEMMPQMMEEPQQQHSPILQALLGSRPMYSPYDNYFRR